MGSKNKSMSGAEKKSKADPDLREGDEGQEAYAKHSKQNRRTRRDVKRTVSREDKQGDRSHKKTAGETKPVG